MVKKHKKSKRGSGRVESTLGSQLQPVTGWENAPNACQIPGLAQQVYRGGKRKKSKSHSKRSSKKSRRSRSMKRKSRRGGANDPRVVLPESYFGRPLVGYSAPVPGPVPRVPQYEGISATWS